MAEIEIVEVERQHQVKIRLDGESVRAEAGAMAQLVGDVDVYTPIPGPFQALAAMLSGEPVIRPRYHGTGEVCLESSFSGFHVFELGDEPWILEAGSYWASEGGVVLGLHRERMLTSYWAGQGLIDFSTKVTGNGKVVLRVPGPVEEVRLDGGRLSVEGRYVIARTAGLDYDIRRPTRSLIGYYLSRERLVCSFSGYGRALLCTTPFWSDRLYQAIDTRR